MGFWLIVYVAFLFILLLFNITKATDFVTFIINGISGGGDYWKNQSLKALAMTTSQGGFITSTASPNGDGRPDPEPDHLLVLVHGIYASPSDWRYVEAELKRRLGRHFLIYASSCNTYSKTFSGIDGAGKRLADEVKQIVKSRDNLKKISFLAHSLGEKLAAPLAPMFVGRTGTQLFLTDGKPDKPPLLLRMTTDSQEADFISALGAFRYRILYANVSYDHMVGWRTSSIRRESELVKPPFKSLDGYQHVVDVEYCPPVVSTGANFPPEAAKAKEAAQNVPTTKNTLEYHEIMEEEMIRGLQQLGWKKVDVSFHASFWPFFAHNNIHVKDEWFHKAGAGVIAHVADSINQQEKQHQTTSLISASL
ncbi:hydrolase-like protein family [Artemisia annua]|uniref:Hydrolase-like protein family n=1 Tax=Artemisia annua TaxID=35608 RepID=A0A2U1P4K4_ARTAN|nr:hydrolase-like protein family [Artemisia annua]